MTITLVTEPHDHSYRGLSLTMADHDYTSTTGNFAVDIYSVALSAKQHGASPEEVVRALAEAFEITAS